jgi:Cu2+-containing amine oxidase
MNTQVVNADISIKEQISETLDSFNQEELKQVFEFISFLKFRARLNLKFSFDETELATLYAEFAEEDRKPAEEAMDEYIAGLFKKNKS